MNQKGIFVAVGLTIAIGCSGSNQTSTQTTEDIECGVERWHVKNLADLDTSLINFGNINKTTIASEVTIPKPSSPDTRLPLERDVIQITATLVSYKKEDDGDIHLLLQDTIGNTLLAELPAATCSPASHTSRSGNYATALQWLKNNVGNPTTSFKDCNITITVTGVRFFTVSVGLLQMPLRFIPYSH